MKLATFNLENLDLVTRKGVTFGERINALRPILVELGADILCVQEVNGQKVRGEPRRELRALELLLEGTPYASWDRCSTLSPTGRGVVEAHNLVIVSRYPIAAARELMHKHVPPIGYTPVTARPLPTEPQYIRFDRPVLCAELTLPSGERLTVFNAHLRAALASPVTGQKRSAKVWNSLGGWAEGLFVSAIKRAAQALDLRLEVDSILGMDPDALIAIAGDMNSETVEMPSRILMGASEETGNLMLQKNSLICLEEGIPTDRRYTVLYNGRRQMLDHIFVSDALGKRALNLKILNAELVDESSPGTAVKYFSGSFHAPLIAEFSEVQAKGNV
ncbi:MAG TPA: endonuclease/exonuclease/phosphatase family protein [Hyphomicrobiaceae bacterium]|nr:endonuclease/exonuclease/phosphatase family protein [Hyphomicrobiaceae bacterium]